MFPKFASKIINFYCTLACTFSVILSVLVCVCNLNLRILNLIIKHFTFYHCTNWLSLHTKTSYDVRTFLEMHSLTSSLPKEIKIAAKIDGLDWPTDRPNTRRYRKFK